MRQVLVAFCIFYLGSPGLAKPNPFLLQSSSFFPTLLSSALRLTPQEENIEIIPKEKSSRLEAPDTSPDLSFVFPTDNPETTANIEPNFIKYKVNKIAQKLAFLTQFVIPTQKSSRLEVSSNETDTFPDNPESGTNPESNFIKYKVNKLVQKWATLSQLSDAILLNYQAQRKESLYPNLEELEDGNEVADGVNLERNSTKDGEVPGEGTDNDKKNSFAIYVFELFASLVGLAVGAVAHINHTFNQNSV